jgi:hypothetical protein
MRGAAVVHAFLAGRIWAILNPNERAGNYRVDGSTGE